MFKKNKTAEPKIKSAAKHMKSSPEEKAPKKTNIVIDEENKKKIYKITRKQAFAAGLSFIIAVSLCIVTGIGFLIHHIIERNRIYSEDDFNFSDYSQDGKIEYKPDSNEWYEDYIKNLVMLDFADFESADEIPDDMLIKFGLWETLTNSDTEYQADKKGEVSIPASDVEAFIKLHFKLSRKIEHHSITDGNVRYKEKEKIYAIPSYGYDNCNIPKVTKITKNKSDVVLEVDYYNSLEYYNKMNISTSETSIQKDSNVKLPSTIATDESTVDVKPLKKVVLTLVPNGKQYRFASLKTV